MTTFINLTNVDITVISDNGVFYDGRTYSASADKIEVIKLIPKSGILATVEQSLSDDSEFFDGVPVRKTVYGNIYNLPAPTENTIYIVSGLVASRANRPDVVSPGALVRDSQDSKTVIGCLFLQRS